MKIQQYTPKMEQYFEGNISTSVEYVSQSLGKKGANLKINELCRQCEKLEKGQM